MIAHPDRETLGVMVRQIWIEYCQSIGDTQPSHLLPWSELDEPNKEADRVIGERLIIFIRVFYDQQPEIQDRAQRAAEQIVASLPVRPAAMIEQIALVIRKEITSALAHDLARVLSRMAAFHELETFVHDFFNLWDCGLYSTAKHEAKPKVVKALEELRKEVLTK